MAKAFPGRRRCARTCPCVLTSHDGPTAARDCTYGCQGTGVARADHDLLRAQLRALAAVAVPTLERLFPLALAQTEALLVWSLEGKHTAEPWRTDALHFLAGKLVGHAARDLKGQLVDEESHFLSATHAVSRALMLAQRRLGGDRG